MSEQKKNGSAFQDLRNSFEGLEVDEQARFLVEAALSLVANGAREAGNAVQSVVDDLVETIQREREAEQADESEAEAGAEKKAEPKTRAKAGKTTRKKAAPKKSAPKAKSSGDDTAA